MNAGNKYPVLVSETGSGYDFFNELETVYGEAKKYMLGFKWCNKIENAELYFNMGSPLSIFLFYIENNQSADDNKIWVIAGDLPKMYLDTYGATSIKEVLLNYIELADDWSNAILNKESLDECFPFKESPSDELALMLKQRTQFIRSSILENIEDIEIAEK